MHHIFFPPRFQIILLQNRPHLRGTDVDFFTFRRLLRQQTKRPTCLPLRGVGAGESDDLCLVLLMECHRPPRSGGVVESTINAMESAACAHIHHRSMRCPGVPCNVSINHALIGLEKDEGATNDTSGM